MQGLYQRIRRLQKVPQVGFCVVPVPSFHTLSKFSGEGIDESWINPIRKAKAAGPFKGIANAGGP
jgi:hypothetical protein